MKELGIQALRFVGLYFVYIVMWKFGWNVVRDCIIEIFRGIAKVKQEAVEATLEKGRLQMKNDADRFREAFMVQFSEASAKYVEQLKAVAVAVNTKHSDIVQ